MDPDLEQELGDWLRRQEMGRFLTESTVQAALARATGTRQKTTRLELVRWVLFAVGLAGIAVWAVIFVFGSSSVLPSSTIGSGTPLLSPSRQPSDETPSAASSEQPFPPFSWYTFNWWREGDHVEGPQNPTGTIHLAVRAGSGSTLSVVVDRQVGSPRPPVEEGATPFASTAAGSLLYGFTSTDGAELHQVTIADGSDSAVLALRAAVPWAVLDEAAGTVYFVRLGLADRRYEGIWEVSASGASARRVLAPSPGLSSSARIRLYLTPDRDRLVVLECEPARPCALRVWGIGTQRPGLEIRGVPADDLAGLTDREVIIGSERIDLLTGATSTIPSCGRGVVVQTGGDPFVVYEADRPASSRCAGDAYRLVALDLSTGRESQVWSSASEGVDASARLLVPDDGLGLLLPPSMFVLSADGEPPSAGRAFLVALPRMP